ncbi:hypothetical protein BH20BAC1_BH20BAC1_00240 [soil metagenome]
MVLANSFPVAGDKPNKSEACLAKYDKFWLLRFITYWFFSIVSGNGCLAVALGIGGKAFLFCGNAQHATPLITPKYPYV